MKHIATVNTLLYSIFLISFINSSINTYNGGNQADKNLARITELPKVIVPDQVDLSVHDPAMQRDIRGSDFSVDQRSSAQIDRQQSGSSEEDDFLANTILSSQGSSDLDSLIEVSASSDDSSNLIKNITDGYRILINNQSLPWLQAEERYLESRYNDLHALMPKASGVEMLLELNKVSLKMIKRLIEEKRLLASRNKSWIEKFMSLAKDLY